MKLSPSLTSEIKPEKLKIRLGELERLNNSFSLPAFAEEYLKVQPDERVRIEESHKKWLSDAKLWLQDYSDFKLSYRFISGHPAFWHYNPYPHKIEEFENFVTTAERREHDGYPPEEFLELVELKCENLANFGVFYKNIFLKATGNIFDLECGHAIHPFLLSSYHTYSLDAQGKTFEEAYTRVALNLYHHFGLQLSDDPASGYSFDD